MSRAATKSRLEKKLSAQQNPILQTPLPNIALPGCTEQDWNFVIEREQSEDVVEEIVREILSETDNLVLHRFVKRTAIEYAAERIKDDVIHMCEWLYAKRDIEVDECYSINLDDEEPTSLDMDSLGSGCVPSMYHVVPHDDECHIPKALVICQNGPITNICPPLECPSLPLSNVKEIMKIRDPDTESVESNDEEEPATEPTTNVESQRQVTILDEVRPIQAESDGGSTLKSVVTNVKVISKDVPTTANPNQVNMLSQQKRLTGRNKSQSLEKRIPINYTVKDQIYNHKKAMNTKTYKEIKSYSKVSFKERGREMSFVEPHPAAIDSIRLSEGVTIYQLNKTKANPLQPREVNYNAIKLEKTKALQPVFGCKKGIIEPVLSTNVKIRAPQHPLTLPPISRAKNPRSLC